MNDITKIIPNKFLIQTINSEIQFDFQWELIQAIKGTNWFRNEIIYEYVLSDVDVPNCIPIGSVEFTLNYMEKYHGKKIKPLHIPEILMQDKYLKRECRILERSQININELTFVKSVDKIKGFTEIINSNIQLPKLGNFFISQIVDIDSEWRCFIYNEKLVGLQNYSGEFTLFPDVNLIEEIIYNKNLPKAYTLDIGINNHGTFILELHEFFSCGTYGFSDHKLIPLMYKSWFRECINKNY